MLRVARKAVILIEPVDIGIQMPFIVFLKNSLDVFSTELINKIWRNRFSFETVGNYVYKISEREIEKIAMGLNYPLIAFKGINDYHSNTLDFSQPTTNLTLFRKVKTRIILKNILSKLGLIPYQLQSCIIFKEYPNKSILKQLNEHGYKVIQLKRNPYLTFQ
jgi:hypothetical protein